MSHTSCARCRKSERIPTHQFVKFDTEVQYLCGDCWAGFRGWFFASERIRRIEGSSTPFSDPRPLGDDTPSSHVA